jgi:hypothetical protein
MSVLNQRLQGALAISALQAEQAGRLRQCERQAGHLAKLGVNTGAQLGPDGFLSHGSSISNSHTGSWFSVRRGSIAQIQHAPADLHRPWRTHGEARADFSATVVNLPRLTSPADGIP